MSRVEHGNYIEVRILCAFFISLFSCSRDIEFDILHLKGILGILDLGAFLRHTSDTKSWKCNDETHI